MNITYPQLGLADDVWSDIISNVDVIVHTAGRMNPTQDLQFFEQEIKALCRFRTFGFKCEKQPRMVFISSISSGAARSKVSNTTPALIPELPLSKIPVAANNGFAEFRWVSEALLH